MCLAIPGRLEERTEDPFMPTGKVSFGGIKPAQKFVRAQ